MHSSQRPLPIHLLSHTPTWLKHSCVVMCVLAVAGPYTLHYGVCVSRTLCTLHYGVCVSRTLCTLHYGVCVGRTLYTALWCVCWQDLIHCTMVCDVRRVLPPPPTCHLFPIPSPPRACDQMTSLMECICLVCFSRTLCTSRTMKTMCWTGPYTLHYDVCVGRTL